MQSRDQFDEIGTEILLSDAALALTFIHIAQTRPEGHGRTRLIQNAEKAYHYICESMCLVRMDNFGLAKLRTMLCELRATLDDLRRPAEILPTR